MLKTLNTIRNTILPAVLNSYSMIFFFKNTTLAFFILLASFLNVFAGFSGLIAVTATVLIANSMGFDKIQLKMGLYSFNALLLGIGMGTFFDPSLVFFSLLLLAALLTLILSVTLGGWFGKYGLPFLSLPFVLTFWFIVLPASQFENLGLTQRNIYWMNELYAIGGDSLLSFYRTIDALPLHKVVDIYLRSMSSIFFQDNLIAGLLIAVALLFCSRIAFSLSILGFASAYLFAQFSGSEAASITYYNIGANYMMVAIAVGGFFVIPSKSSYLWTVLLVPLTSLVLLFMSKLFGNFQLPVFSLPFSFVVILFVYFLKLRTKSKHLNLTPIQYFSPEINLYTYQNSKERLANLLYFPFKLPFWGEWTVTQGHDGVYTHKGDWGQAFDFMIYDNDGKTYRSDGLLCQDYLCYNKPILAPADGIVEEIVDFMDDNEIGKVNTTSNWGNTIIIRHLPGLYTQLSHLKKGSFKVSKGDTVKCGDVLALCGNSGRSPEPHVHYQVQSSPMLGARTIDYPFSYYYEKESTGSVLKEYTKPVEGAVVSGINMNPLLRSAFEIAPSTILKFRFTDKTGVENTAQWEAFTDAYNQKYLYCKDTDSSAFYVNDHSMFYFTAFYGDKESLLYSFYRTAYKVFLGSSDPVTLRDAMPLHVIQHNKAGLWLHDFIAPFYTFLRVWHLVKTEYADNPYDSGKILLKTETQVCFFKKNIKAGFGSILLQDNRIQEFCYETEKTKIKAICIS